VVAERDGTLPVPPLPLGEGRGEGWSKTLDDGTFWAVVARQILADVTPWR